MKRKICIFTSARAEYGLLKGVMQGIKETESLHLQIIASGMHLSPEFGLTIHEILADGFNPDETVEILLSGDTPTAICKSMGLAMIGYGEALERLRPDILLLLGDRFETFCMGAAAQIFRVPLAHIHGGETSEGAIDEAFRHSLTKMSHLHFASCEAYRQRIIQLGEFPERVFNVGALGVENIRRISLMEREELAQAIGLNSERPYFLITFHPVTLEMDTSGSQCRALLEALDAFPEFNLVFTKANADTNGRIINRLIDEYAESRSGRCLVITSLGVNRYLSVMRYAAAVVGNSSSGIIETPSFGVPTVNIGDRQKGRVRAESVLDCEPTVVSIAESLRIAISEDFRKGLAKIINPYEKADTASMIVDTLKSFDCTRLIKKSFYDLGTAVKP